jgi:hypothetical protein
VLALAAAMALLLADVPLLTIRNRHFDATGSIPYSVHPHWPLVVTTILFIIGLILVTFPRRRNAT